MLRIATFASVLALGITCAQAADTNAGTPAPFNWTGFYVGVHAGIAAGKFDHKASGYADEYYYPEIYEDDTPTGTYDYFTDEDYYAGSYDYAFNFDHNAIGAFGGGQIGGNIQFDHVVFGAVADISASSLKGDGEYNVGYGSGVSLAASSEVQWFGTVRGRVGLAFDNLLFYGTGGLAYGKVKTSYSASFSGNGDNNDGYDDYTATASGSTSATKFGWAAGGGVEYGITPNVTLSTEYLYVDLGRSKSSPGEDGYFGTDEHYSSYDDFYLTSWETKSTFHTVKVGLNYKF